MRLGISIGLGRTRRGGHIYLPPTGGASTSVDPAQCAISVVGGGSSVASGSAKTLRLQLKNASGQNLSSASGLTIVPSKSGGTATGTLSGVTDNGDGTVDWTYTGILVGTAQTMGATINTVAITGTVATLSVTPGPFSLANSVISLAASSGSAGGTPKRATLQAKDAAGNPRTAGGGTVVLAIAAGGSTMGATTDAGDGTYWADITPNTEDATPRAVTGTYNGSPIETTAPTFTVTAAATWYIDPADYGMTLLIDRGFASVATASSSTAPNIAAAEGFNPGDEGAAPSPSRIALVTEPLFNMSGQTAIEVTCPAGLAAGQSPAKWSSRNFSSYGMSNAKRVYARGEVMLGPDFHIGAHIGDTGVWVKMFWFLSNGTGGVQAQPFISVDRRNGKFALSFDAQGCGNALQGSPQPGPDNGHWNATGIGADIQTEVPYRYEMLLVQNSAAGVYDGIFILAINGTPVIVASNIDYYTGSNGPYWLNFRCHPTHGGSGGPTNVDPYTVRHGHCAIYGAA